MPVSSREELDGLLAIDEAIVGAELGEGTEGFLCVELVVAIYSNRRRLRRGSGSSAMSLMSYFDRGRFVEVECASSGGCADLDREDRLDWGMVFPTTGVFCLGRLSCISG